MNNIVIFILIIPILIVYAYISGGEAAMIISTIFIVAPILSIIMALIVKRKVEVSTYIPNVNIEKNEVIEVTAIIRNKSIIPIPFIDLIFIKSLNFTFLKKEIFRCILGPNETITITMPYKGSMRGKSNIGIKSMTLKDYLGVSNFSLLKHLKRESLRKEVIVMPRIFDINQTNRELFNFVNIKRFRGDGEEHETNSLIGEPGYELREYIAGDSLRRINWKASAKRNTLMVRKSQESIGKKRILILDPCKYTIKPHKNVKHTEKNVNIYRELSKEVLYLEERTLEFLLSVADSVIKDKNNIEIYLFEDEQWKVFKINNQKDVREMQCKLATYRFLDKSKNTSENRLPINELSKNLQLAAGGEAIVFTGYPDKRLSDLINICERSNIQINTVWIKSGHRIFEKEPCINRNLVIITEDQMFNEEAVI